MRSQMRSAGASRKDVEPTTTDGVQSQRLSHMLDDICTDMHIEPRLPVMAISQYRIACPTYA